MALSDLDRHNLGEIQGLNQRGGRMLSLVDLIEANTLSLDMAAEAASCMSGGASLLTAAMPGGSGKTTVMAALLCFLPPGVRIVTVADGSALRRRYEDPVCFLPHEIGSGPWFGYLWGREVKLLFDVTREQHTFASCLHADTLPELTEILYSPELGVSPKDLERLELALFLRVRSGLPGTLRRVSHVYTGSGPGGHSLRWEWSPTGDEFLVHAGTPEPSGRGSTGLTAEDVKGLLLDLTARNQRTLAEVREAFVAALG